MNNTGHRVPMQTQMNPSKLSRSRALEAIDQRIDKRLEAIRSAEKYKALQEAGAYKPLVRFLIKDYVALKANCIQMRPDDFAVAQAKAQVGLEAAQMLAQAIHNMPKLQKSLEQDLAAKSRLTGERY